MTVPIPEPISLNPLYSDPSAQLKFLNLSSLPKPRLTSSMLHRHSAKMDGRKEGCSLKALVGLSLSLTTGKVRCAFGRGCEATKHKELKSLTPSQERATQTVCSMGVVSGPSLRTSEISQCPPPLTPAREQSSGCDCSEVAR